MPIKKEIQDLHSQMTEWRRDLHRHPETAFQETRTSQIVADHLTKLGMEVHRGLAKTGVVGVLKAGNSSKKIGLRADMDALDLEELNTFSHKSVYAGKMHGCGHDGHTAMLLGAAHYLARTKNFDGTVYFIFQPAEENEAGARVMIKDGLFEKFPAMAVYGMHNRPTLPMGHFGVLEGPCMASADMFEIKIQGHGAHAAYPQKSVDPIVVGAEIVTALQTIVSRRIDPVENAVVSVTQFHAGSTNNVIPDMAVISGTARSLKFEVQDQIEESLKQIVHGICATYGAKAQVTYERRYCPTINSPMETEKARLAASQVVGQPKILTNLEPSMGAEDFGWMLKEKPGCYVWLGAGTGPDSCMIHNPHYDFNDELLPIGASYWATLVENELR